MSKRDVMKVNPRKPSIRKKYKQNKTKLFHNNTQSKQTKSKHLIINTPFGK
jgi:hypothetical protein